MLLPDRPARAIFVETEGRTEIIVRLRLWRAHNKQASMSTEISPVWSLRLGKKMVLLHMSLLIVSNSRLKNSKEQVIHEL